MAMVPLSPNSIPKLDGLMMHLDLDTFFVSVERLHNPKLVGVPVAVGGTSPRSIVSSVSYEARKYGVRSGMPTGMAMKLCPSLIVTGSGFEMYRIYSSMVTGIVAQRAPLYEKASVDEFYIDLSGMSRFYDVTTWAIGLLDQIRSETKLPVSAGLSVTKTMAKMATSRAKPNGFYFVPANEIPRFLDETHISKMPMLGPKLAEKLEKMGIHTLGELAKLSPEQMWGGFGRHGLSLYKKLHCIDPSPISEGGEAKSMSMSRTLVDDLKTYDEVRTCLLGLAEALAMKMRSNGKLTGCVGIKLRKSDFTNISAETTITPTNSDATILATLDHLLGKHYHKGMALRLVGARFSTLHDGSEVPGTLFGDTQAEGKLLKAMDGVRKRFGVESLGRASLMISSPVIGRRGGPRPKK